MFTGLVTEMGTILSAAPGPGGVRLTFSAPRTARGLAVGGSVAVDGVCLTAVTVGRGRFSVDVIPETVRRSTFGRARAGRRVNLERPLRAGAELGGHFVQGHVDARARVIGLERASREAILAVELPRSLRGLVVEKGSIAINGVSLTVASVAASRFTVALIPHTLRETNLGLLERGDRLHLEADILGKYVRALARPRR